MRRAAAQWGLPGMLALSLCSVARPVHAQTLDVCNKGTVTIQVVVAKRVSLIFHSWVITGTPIAPRACARVYDEGRGRFIGNEYPAYIGFGFADSQGQWGSGTVADPVPDMGLFEVFSQTPILKRGEQTLCVHQDKTYYQIEQDPIPPSNCAMWETPTGPNDVGHGPYVPLAAALYFQPKRGSLNPDPINGGGNWVDGDYYLNIAPSATARDVHTSLGSPDGTTPAP